MAEYTWEQREADFDAASEAAIIAYNTRRVATGDPEYPELAAVIMFGSDGHVSTQTRYEKGVVVKALRELADSLEAPDSNMVESDFSFEPPRPEWP